MKTLIGLFIAACILASAFVFSACSCDGDKKVDKDDTGNESVITTPSGRRGVYCTSLRYSTRTDCYKFISRKCPAGYDFVRESDDAVMIECKQGPGE